MRNLVITSGDRDGVGLEVSIKALAQLGPQKGSRFVLAAHQKSRGSVRQRHWKNLLKRWKVLELHGHDPAEAFDKFDLLESQELLVFFDSRSTVAAEATWVECAVRLGLEEQIQGLITGPVSKRRFSANHFADMGHTGLLSRLTKTQVFQGYVGPKMAVVLATDHVELKRVEKTLTPQRLKGAYSAALELRSFLSTKARYLPIAVLGLNPHAGESGHIGRFEVTQLSLPKGFVGPIPADSAFQKLDFKSYSVFLALYHDQGLIPFKMLHGQQSGFQISLGLPFLRTSVDHGTARDIFSRDVADSGSMRDAIKAACCAKAPKLVGKL
jgi:4-hydroxy-L-threonine phosphate dehydrogenase PdxA